MFDLSVITDEVSQDFEWVVEVGTEYGVTALEPTAASRICLEKTNNILADLGIKLWHN